MKQTFSMSMHSHSVEAPTENFRKGCFNLASVTFLTLSGPVFFLKKLQKTINGISVLMIELGRPWEINQTSENTSFHLKKTLGSNLGPASWGGWNLSERSRWHTCKLIGGNQPPPFLKGSQLVFTHSHVRLSDKSERDQSRNPRNYSPRDC